MAGTLVAHSVLQNGPGLPCLYPAIYHAMVNGDNNSSDNELPKMSTSMLPHLMLEMIDHVRTLVNFFGGGK